MHIWNGFIVSLEKNACRKLYFLARGRFAGLLTNTFFIITLRKIIRG